MQKLEEKLFIDYPLKNFEVFKCVLKLKKVSINKAELPQVGILFGTQFPSLGIFISKKVGF